MSVIFSRVDSRGLHGQVVLRWMSIFKCDGCLIVDDEIAHSESLTFVYKNAAPEGMRVHIFDETKALTKLPEATASTKSYFLIVRNPLVLERLARNDMKLDFMKELVMGPTLNGPDTHNVTGAWNYTVEEFKALDYLASLGIEIRFQMTPEQPKYYWKDMRKNFKLLLGS